MEKFLFKKIEVWIVLLLFVFWILGTILFGAVVKNVTNGFDRFGVLGKMAFALADIPATARILLAPDRSMVAFDRGAFSGRSGWRFLAQTPAGLSGYLLISRYDGNKSRHAVELLDLAAGEVVYTWWPDADRLLAGAQQVSNVVTFERQDTKHFRAIHPYLLSDGSLIIKDHQSPLMQIDPCGGLVWRQDKGFFHHSTEKGADNSFWLPGRIEPPVVEGVSQYFRDDSIIQVSEKGDVLYEKSVAEIFVENGYKSLLFARGDYQNDPLHLNDVQPVLSSGPYWEKGDLFLSLRNLSMVALYRPSTGRIIWMKQGPWAAQHDIDIIDDSTIALFNNNAYNFDSSWRGAVDGTNDIVFYDFASDTVSNPYKSIFEENDIKTVTDGLFEVLPGGNLLIEEENNGRILFFDPEGNLAAELINRADDGFVYRLGWSRYIDQELGDRVRAKLGSKQCDVPE